MEDYNYFKPSLEAPGKERGLIMGLYKRGKTWHFSYVINYPDGKKKGFGSL
jgi:hypothetical protein